MSRTYTPTEHCSINAVAQALKNDGCTRRAIWDILGLPDCMTATRRYWTQDYNILDWDSRTDEERAAACRESARLINEYVAAGNSIRKHR